MASTFLYTWRKLVGDAIPLRRFPPSMKYKCTTTFQNPLYDAICAPVARWGVNYCNTFMSGMTPSWGGRFMLGSIVLTQDPRMYLCTATGAYRGRVCACPWGTTCCNLENPQI